MEQKQLPVPPPESEGEGMGLDFFANRRVETVEGVEDTLAGIDSVLDEKQKMEPLHCCGILPCKGRTPACYGCSVCMDCITGAGCGHDDSTHKPQTGLENS